MSERIPNYRLRKCHEDNLNQFISVKRLQLHQLWNCFSLIHWDHESCQLVSANRLGHN
ncbi:delta-12 fatty acid desaturase DesA3 [Synechococcus sp. A18-40]|nr:delta-12 fatty acid desaturase DesA3 [Synechococcus sp. A18-40]